MSEAGTMFGLREPLQRIVSRKFHEAYRNKDLLFSDTKLDVLRTKHDASFQLRYCPALAKKPKKDEKKDMRAPKFDPFAEPPAELLVATIPRNHPSHVLVLNKFPVIHNHFIIATIANKPQTDLLELGDLTMTYECLRAWQSHQSGRGRPRLFAFFNSGEHSGASQVHRHLQFLPVEDMSSSDSPDWSLVVDRMTVPAHPDLLLFHDPSFPLAGFSTPLVEKTSPEMLHSKYLLLLKAALSAARCPGQPLNDSTEIEKQGQTTFSYNLAMTTERMAICPRRAEAVAVPGAGSESSVALNGTILAGTLMVKHESEWDILRQNPLLLDDMLATVGYAPATWN